MIGDLPIVPHNRKFLAKFHSGELRITYPIRLMSLYSIIAETSIRIHLNILKYEKKTRLINSIRWPWDEGRPTKLKRILRLRFKA